MPPSRQLPWPTEEKKSMKGEKRKVAEDKKGRGSKPAGRKYEMHACVCGHGYDALPPHRVRVRMHKEGVDGNILAICLVAPIPRINFIVCSLCGDATTWNSAGKHKYGDDQDEVIESQDALCEILSGTHGEFLWY